MRPIRLPSNSVNHRLPSGPAVIPSGALPSLIPSENSVTTPLGVMRPMRFPARPARLNSVNQRLPSGPAVMPAGELPALMPARNSVTAPGRGDPPDPVPRSR